MTVSQVPRQSWPCLGRYKRVLSKGGRLAAILRNGHLGFRLLAGLKLAVVNPIGAS